MSIDYDAWAKTYDDSRGASPSVLRPIAEELGAPDGRSLLTIRRDYQSGRLREVMAEYEPLVASTERGSCLRRCLSVAVVYSMCNGHQFTKRRRSALVLDKGMAIGRARRRPGHQGWSIVAAFEDD